VWQSTDRVPGFSFVEGNDYIIAMRIRYEGTADATSFTIQVGGASSAGGDYAFLDLDDGEAMFNGTALTAYTAKSDGDSIPTGQFVCNTGGGTLIPGKFQAVNDPSITFAMSPGEETEIWLGVTEIGGDTTQYAAFRFSGTASQGQFSGPIFDPGDTSWTGPLPIKV
jgi:hypothetical protein